MSQRSFQKSFIPKQRAAADIASGSKTGVEFNIPTLTGIVLFLAVCATALGFFLYAQYLTGSIEDQQQTLSAELAKIDTGEQRALMMFDRRISAAETILAQHIAPSHTFSLLERDTLRDLSFRTFDFKATPENTVSFTLSGRAQDFGDVALQADVLREEEALQHALVSGLTVRRDEIQGRYVEFTIEGEVAPEIVSYTAHAAAPEPVPTFTATTTTTAPTTTSAAGNQMSATSTATSSPTTATSTPASPQAAPEPNDDVSSGGENAGGGGWWQAISSFVRSLF